MIKPQVEKAVARINEAREANLEEVAAQIISEIVSCNQRKRDIDKHIAELKQQLANLSIETINPDTMELE